MTRLYLDTSLVIRFLEGTPDERELLDRRLAGTRTGTDLVVTTELLRFECLVKPRRDGNEDLVHKYEEFFASEGTSMAAMDRRVFDAAIDIRAEYRFKAPDALHLAAAVVWRCETFLTSDGKLARFKDLVVEEFPRST